MKSRSQAIRTAIQRYNTLASQFNPPRSPLKYDQVVKHAFLSEFEFLRLSRADSRMKKWAQPRFREVIEAHLRIRRAHEETTRIEIEARRLLTFMAHEEEQLAVLAQSVEGEKPELAMEILAVQKRRKAANVLNRVWIDKLMTHPDFDGSRALGVPIGEYPVPSAPQPHQDPVHLGGPPVQAVQLGIELPLDQANEDDCEEMYMTIEDYACSQPH